MSGAAGARVNTLTVGTCVPGAGYMRPTQVVFAGDGSVTITNQTNGTLYLADYPGFNFLEAQQPGGGGTGIMILGLNASYTFDGTFDVWAAGGGTPITMIIVKGATGASNVG